MPGINFFSVAADAYVHGVVVAPPVLACRGRHHRWLAGQMKLLRRCLLALFGCIPALAFAGFNVSASAPGYNASVCFTTFADACSFYGGSLIAPDNVACRIPAVVGGGYSQVFCNDECPAGKIRNAQGVCVDPPCPEGTARRGSSLASQWDGIGRSGWSPLSQECETIADNCARRAANDDVIYSSALLTKSNNCQVSCALRVGGSGGDSRYSCYYTGEPAVPNGQLVCSSDPTGELCATAVGSNQPQDLTGGFTPGVPSGGCPAGSTQGTLNGVAGCASSSGVNVSSSTGNPSTGGGSATGTNTQISTTTTTTSTLPNGSTVTTTITSTQGQLGTAGNPLQVEQSGAKQCDPTAANYAQCIDMAGAVTAGVNAAGSGSGGGGEGEGAGECDPTAANYIECISPSNALDHTDNGVKSFQSITDEFIDSVRSGDIGQMATGLGGSMPAGQCPTASFAMFGQSFVIDQHCQLLDSISGALSVMMHIVWVVMGVLILLSA